MTDILKEAEERRKYCDPTPFWLAWKTVLEIYNQAIEDAADKLDRMNGTNCGDDIRNLKKDMK